MPSHTAMGSELVGNKHSKIEILRIFFSQLCNDLQSMRFSISHKPDKENDLCRKSCVRKADFEDEFE